MRRDLVTLTSQLPDGLPTEFRVFVRGANATSKGDYVFDDESAVLVLAAYEEHGADVMIDLEHLSLEDPANSRGFDPDARGWARLEMRPDGLWAVGVRWTPDGEARLREKRQRYISPAFRVDGDRVVEVINIAITAMPATHGLAPLVAANAATGGEENNSMNAEQMSALAEALGLGADANVEDVIAAIGALLAKVKAGVEGEPSDEVSESEQVGEALAGAEDEDKMEAKALRAALLRETNAPSSVQALSQVASWKASHLALEAERVKLSRERAALELAERKDLVASLVKLGAETPATSGLAVGKIVKRLLDEPLVELRDRVAALSKVPRGSGAPKAPSGNTSGLTDREIALCQRKGIDIAKYAALRSQIKARSAGKETSR